MNFKFADIETILEEVNNCITFYEKTFIQNKTFIMYLGNGEKVQYFILPNNVPHLLGINIDYIRSSSKYSEKNAFELLKEVCQNPYKLYKLFCDGILKQEQVFSKNINEKITGFKRNLSSDVITILEDTNFVCSFKSEKSWEYTDKNQKFDYIIVKILPDGNVSLLCLVKKGYECYAMSNQFFNSIEKVNEVFKELLPN